MTKNYLDKTGLSHFWQKIKTYISNATVSKANQLTTGRLINGVSFNGTANITIKANPIENQLNDEDLDDYHIQTGFYYAGGNNTVANKPSGVDAFSLLVYRSAAGYFIQELTAGNTNPMKKWIRQYTNGQWTSWKDMNYLKTLSINGKVITYTKGDGTTGTLTTQDTTYGVVSASQNGLMSPTLLSKLNGIENNANNYVLPKASSNTLGGIKIGEGLNISEDGTVSTNNTGGISQADLLDLIFPIGRGFIDFTDTDYSNYLGGTWERELVGMFPIGYNPNDPDFNTIGKTGGEKTHKLTLTEIPSHNHSIRYRNLARGIGDAKFNIPNNGTANTFLSSYRYNNGNNLVNPSDSNAYYAANTGGGQAHNNLPPFQVVAYWKRVA